MTIYTRFLLGIVFLTVFSACSDLTRVDELELDPKGEYAIPLINTSASILEIADNTSSNASVRVDPDGKLTVLYSAEPVRRDVREIFAPLEFSVPIFVLDSVFIVPLPVENFPDEWVLNRATLSDVNIRWVLETDLNEEINVEISIPELSLNGEIYKDNFVIPADQSSILTPDIDIDGWELILSNNNMTVNYTATRPNGERILLETLIFQFDRLDFDYIEGFFGREVNPVQGNVITVGAFSNWLSGGLWFEEPRVNIRVENSFGFPTRAEFNEIRFTTVDQNVWQMDGEFIQNGVEFDYPSLSEVGVIKKDSFLFSTSNSNIQQIFNEKVAEVFFDIDAIGNPDDDPTVIGFIKNDSYYEVFTDVEMPLLMYANDLLLTDTFDLDFEGYEDISSAEFKLVTENDFPFEVGIQMYFQENGVITDSLFTDKYVMEASSVDTDGTLLTPGTATALVPYGSDRIDKAVRADKVIFIVNMQSPTGEVPLWIYDDYTLDLRLGAKVRFTE